MGERERLILVDDNGLTLGHVREILERAGHRVVGEAQSPADVLDLLQGAEPDFTVAIVDGLDGQGAEVARTLREARPKVKIIAHSGSVQKFGDRFVRKPDFKGDLLKTVAEL